MITAEMPDVRTFEAALTEARLRQFQVIHAALAAGVLTFAAVVVGLYLTTPAAAPDGDAGFLWTLTMIHLSIAIGLVLVRGMLSRGPLRPAALLHRSSGPPGEAESWLNAMLSSAIIQLALLEGAALFGIVICLLGVVDGILHTEPLLWVNLLSAVVMLAYVARTFPSHGYLVDWYRRELVT